MAYSHSFGLAALSVLGGAFCVLSGCGSDAPGRGSVVSAGGDTAQAGGRAASGGGTGRGEAGEAGEASQAGGADAGDGGAAGSVALGTPPTPLALYPSTLDADVGCDGAPDASLLIQNAGGSTLEVTSASADSGYVVNTKLPLSIEPGAAASLLVTPPAAAANVPVGDKTSGTLSFRTNEPTLPTRRVSLSSELFSAALEFTDHDGAPLTAPLTLSYLNAGSCPDTVKYRVHNHGNVAITLLGPTFPANFAGTTTGNAGQTIAPGEYVELMVGGVSVPGNLCGADGQLAFTTKGSYCGSAPSLSVVWPPAAGPTCACTVAP
ncbi:MAG: hypothetical protein ABJB12_05950 [Pseudomonadota bacterium]